MTNQKITLTLITLGLFTLAAMFRPGSQCAAQSLSAVTIDLSAQQDKDKDKKKKAAPQNVPRTCRSATRGTAARRSKPHRAEYRKAAEYHQAAEYRKAKAARFRKAKAVASGAGDERAKRREIRRAEGRQVVHAARDKRYRRDRVPAARPCRRAAPSRTSIRGQNYSAWRSGYRIRRGGGWRTFVALGALGAIIVGGSQFYPYAYISAPEDYCDGLTEDGCQLVWQEVETVEGDVIPQCVAYCPWQ